MYDNDQLIKKWSFLLILVFALINNYSYSHSFSDYHSTRLCLTTAMEIAMVGEGIINILAHKLGRNTYTMRT